MEGNLGSDQLQPTPKSLKQRIISGLRFKSHVQEDVKEITDLQLRGCLAPLAGDKLEKDQGHVLSSTGYKAKMDFMIFKTRES